MSTNALTDGHRHGLPRPADHLVPGNVALRGGNAHGSSEREEVWRSGQYGAVALDSQDDLVAVRHTVGLAHLSSCRPLKEHAC